MPRRLRRWSRRLLIALLLVFALLAGAGLLAYALTPLPSLAQSTLPAPDTRILDRHGALIVDLPQGGVRHEVVPFIALPVVLRRATIAAEDASFDSNPGIDPFAIVRAAFLDARLDRAAYGGSTITQQLVRDLLLSPQERVSRSLWRKIHEALLAIKVTRHYGKDIILALYLNSVSYGNLTYGAEAAARLYFGRPAASLDLAQAAFLAGLPRAPSLYDPLRHPDLARARQHAVLRLMQQHGYITAAQERLAAAEALHIGSASPAGGLAPHWVTYTLGLVADRLGVDRVERGGLTIKTTLDLGIEQAAQQAVRRRIAAIAKEHRARDAAVVAIEPQSGQILAMVGSADPASVAIDGAYNVALSPRQPGSAIKPFTYLAALDRWSPGAANLGLTAASLLDDVPTTVYTRGQDGARVAYQPNDYDATFLGRVPLRLALGSSLNVPAVETLERVGIPRMLQVAHAAGITTMYRSDRYGPALTLGGGEVTLLDLTSAYGTIAAGGMRHQPRAILGVTDASGRALGDWAVPPATAAFGPRGAQLAALMTDILSDDSARLPAFGADSPLVLPDRPAAAKTGTTSDWHDNWTVGYTPDLVTGVWVGNADNSPMERISGITGAAPIWHDVMEATLRAVAPRPFTLPPGMMRVAVCQATGLPPSPGCQDAVNELFIAGTQPVTSSQWPVASSQQIGCSAGPATAARPAPTVVRAAGRNPHAGHTPGRPLWCMGRHASISGLPCAGGHGPLCSPALPAIDDPPDGTQYALSPDLPAGQQRVAITISGQRSASSRQSSDLSAQGAGRYTALVDGQPAGTCTGNPCTVLWPLRAGRHHLTAVTSNARGKRLYSPGITITVVSGDHP